MFPNLGRRAHSPDKSFGAGADSYYVFWVTRREGDSPIPNWGQRFRSSGDPVGQPALLDDSYVPHEVAHSPWGGFLTVSGGYSVLGRLYTPSGDPLGEWFEIDSEAPAWGKVSVTATDLGYLVTWIDDATAKVQVRFVPHRGEVSERTKVSSSSADHVTVRSDSHGQVVVVYRTSDLYDLRARRLDPSSGLPMGDEIFVNPDGPAILEYEYELAVEPEGGFLVTWVSDSLGEPDNGYRDDLWGRFFDLSDRPLGAPQMLDDRVVPFKHASGATSLPTGSFVVTWGESLDEGLFGYGYTVHGKVFERDGRSSGPSFRIDDPEDGEHAVGGQVAAAPDGRFLVTWSDFATQQVQARLYNGNHVANAIRLHEDRFRVSVIPESLDGSPIAAHGRRLTDDTGSFWFFSQENLEVFVKVLGRLRIQRPLLGIPVGPDPSRIDDPCRGHSHRPSVDPFESRGIELPAQL